MRVGVITGTCTYALPDLEGRGQEKVKTARGDALVTPHRLGAVQVVRAVPKIPNQLDRTGIVYRFEE
jgi:hypothetical protein